MAGINFLGSYSGIDQSTIEQLMAVEKQPLVHMAQKKQDYESEKNAWRDINTRLNSLMTKIKDLKLSSVYNSKSISSSNDSAVSGSASNNAIDGTYSIHVNKIATAPRITGGKILGLDQDNDTALNKSGTFKIENGDGTFKTVDVTVNDSLRTIVSKINDLDKGVTDEAQKLNISATIIDGRIVLQDKKTGDRSINLTTEDTGTPNILTNLGFDSAIVEVGQNAEFTVNGITISDRNTNTIDDVIEGVTFTLKKENSDADITVSQNLDKAVDKVKAFVEQYNSTMSFLKDQSSAGNPDIPGSKGKLSGDGTLQRMISTIRNMVSDTVLDVNSPYSSTSELGITTIDRWGELTLDTNKLKKALKKDPSAVKNFFYGETNVGAKSTVTTSNANDPSLVKDMDTTNATGWTGATGESLNFALDKNREISKVMIYSANSGVLQNFTISNSDGSYSESFTGRTESPATVYLNSEFDELNITIDDTVDNTTDGVASRDILEVEIYQKTGLGEKLESYMDTLLETGTGVVSVKKDSMDRSIKQIEKDIESFNRRMELREKYFINMFSKLDVALQQAESQQAWLASQMAGLSGMMGSQNE